MNEPKFLDKKKTFDSALDFHYLRNEGVKIIQSLTGAFWTDFNVHDPGVTILEQCCYALTELSYRTQYNIEQLLFKGGREDLPFYLPEKILTNNPLTSSDYRKIFLDVLPDIKNIWFEPVSQYMAGFNGLYRVLVDATFENEQEKDSIIEKIKRIFSQHRNIGEDISEIKVLDQLPLNIYADIETDGLNELEEVLARIYFAIEQYVNPEVKFYSLKELLDLGKSYNEIFDGPALQHGFIVTEELGQQPEAIIVSDLVKVVMQVEGVISVKKLYVEVNGEINYTQIRIEKGKVPCVIHKDLLVGNNMGFIQFFKGTLKYQDLEVDGFKRKLNELVSEHKKSYRVKESSFEFPKVQELDFQEYYSIQEHFPAIYGLSSEGFPNKPTLEQLAKAKQLKAYLMLFEQFMANFYAQLAHFKDLLSIHKKLDQTYFYQKLDQVPGAQDIYMKGFDLIEDPYIKFNGVTADYAKGLGQLNEFFDDFVDRKNRILDFLLALHGESYTRYSLKQFNYYYTDDAFKKLQIKCKSALLQQLDKVSYSRGRGIDYYAVDAISSFEKKLQILLGIGVEENDEGIIEIKRNESALAIFQHYALELQSQRDDNDDLTVWLESLSLAANAIAKKYVNSHFDFIDDEDIHSDQSVSFEQLIENSIYFQSRKIHTAYLVNGIRLLNYKLGYLPEGEFAVLFDESGNEDWIVMGRYADEETAIKYVSGFVNFATYLNIGSENLHMVEHILLRPTKEEPMFGIYIKDHTGKNLLKSKQQFTLSQRQEIQDKLTNNITVYDNFSVEADENRDMNIVFKIVKQGIEFINCVPNESVEETHAQLEALYLFLSDHEKITPIEEKLGFYIKYGDMGGDIPDDNYNSRISLVLPNWTARFSNEEFKSVVQDVIWEQKPASIYVDVHWLSPDQMSAFEENNSAWSNGGSKSAGEFANFLYSL